jgi:hypothetical protein
MSDLDLMGTGSLDISSMLDSIDAGISKGEEMGSIFESIGSTIEGAMSAAESAMSGVKSTAESMYDSISSGASSASSSTRDLGEAAKEAGAGAQEAHSSFSMLDAITLGGAIAAAQELVSAVIQIGQEAINSYMELENLSMSSAFHQGGSTAEDFVSSSKDIAEASDYVAVKVGGSNASIAQLMGTLGGFGETISGNKEQMTDLVKPYVEFSHVVGNTPTQAAQLGMLAKNNFGEEPTQALEDYGAAWAKWNLNLDATANALPRISAIAPRLGLGFEGSLALMGRMQQMSIAPTQLASGLTQVVNQVDELPNQVEAQYKKVKDKTSGLTSSVFEGYKVSGLAEKIMNAAKMDPSQTKQFVNNLIGKDFDTQLKMISDKVGGDLTKVFTGGRSGFIAEKYNENSAAIKGMGTEIQKSTGLLAEMETATDEKLGESLERAGNATIAISDKLGNVLAPAAKEAADYISGPLYDSIANITDKFTSGDTSGAVADLSTALTSGFSDISNSLPDGAQLWNDWTASVITAANSTDYSALGTAFGDGIKGALSNVDQLLSGIDYTQWGWAVYGALKGAWDFGWSTLTSLGSSDFQLTDLFTRPFNALKEIAGPTFTSIYLTGNQQLINLEKSNSGTLAQMLVGWRSLEIAGDTTWNALMDGAQGFTDVCIDGVLGALADVVGGLGSVAQAGVNMLASVTGNAPVGGAAASTPSGKLQPGKKYKFASTGVVYDYSTIADRFGDYSLKNTEGQWQSVQVQSNSVTSGGMMAVGSPVEVAFTNYLIENQKMEKLVLDQIKKGVQSGSYDAGKVHIAGSGYGAGISSGLISVPSSYLPPTYESGEASQHPDAGDYSLLFGAAGLARAALGAGVGEGISGVMTSGGTTGIERKSLQFTRELGEKLAKKFVESQLKDSGLLTSTNNPDLSYRGASTEILGAPRPIDLGGVHTSTLVDASGKPIDTGTSTLLGTKSKPLVVEITQGSSGASSSSSWQPTSADNVFGKTLVTVPVSSAKPSSSTTMAPIAPGDVGTSTFGISSSDDLKSLGTQIVKSTDVTQQSIATGQTYVDAIKGLEKSIRDLQTKDDTLFTSHKVQVPDSLTYEGAKSLVDQDVSARQAEQDRMLVEFNKAQDEATRKAGLKFDKIDLLKDGIFQTNGVLDEIKGYAATVAAGSGAGAGGAGAGAAASPYPKSGMFYGETSNSQYVNAEGGFVGPYWAYPEYADQKLAERQGVMGNNAKYGITDTSFYGGGGISQSQDLTINVNASQANSDLQGVKGTVDQLQSTDISIKANVTEARRVVNEWVAEVNKLSPEVQVRVKVLVDATVIREMIVSQINDVVAGL